MHENPAGPTTIEDIGASVLRSGWFLGLASITIITLLVLAGWPWWFNRFALTVTTRVVEVSASAPGVHVLGVELPMHSEIQVFSLHPDGLPPELAALAGGPVSVRLAASRATLQTISLSAQSKLFVSVTSDGRTDIDVLDGGRISLALSGKSLSEEFMRDCIAVSTTRPTAPRFSTRSTPWRIAWRKRVSDIAVIFFFEPRRNNRKVSSILSPTGSTARPRRRCAGELVLGRRICKKSEGHRRAGKGPAASRRQPFRRGCVRLGGGSRRRGSAPRAGHGKCRSPYVHK